MTKSNRIQVKEEVEVFDNFELWNNWLLSHIDPDATAEEPVLPNAFKNGANTDVLNVAPSNDCELLDLLATTTIQNEERIDSMAKRELEATQSESTSKKTIKVKRENAGKIKLNNKAKNALQRAQSVNSVRLFETEPIVHIPFKRRTNRKSKGTHITHEQILENKRVAKNIEDRRRSLIEFLTQLMASKFPMPSNMNEVNKAGTKHWMLLSMIQILCQLQEAAKGIPKLERFFPKEGQPTLADLSRSTEYHKSQKEKNYVIQINPKIRQEHAFIVFGNLLERSPSGDGSLIVKPEKLMSKI